MIRATAISFRGLTRLLDIPVGTQIDIAKRSLYRAYHFARCAYLWLNKAAYARDCVGPYHSTSSWGMRAEGCPHFIQLPPSANDGGVYVDQPTR
ncbi:hypothetical protein FHW18_002629 [Pigmentiphaga litoralis]|uniref:Uncharacterized protein n=1 Tax=Pigmentiphaga litoralis TaxID=516702 RepID=A0A7Y9IUT0_9BURK|nr:hypothetical protein [Pigmentiphaga litoralis]NYE83358.1 hypothetical protein [Pigmentiphaga litoralis]